MIYLNKTGQNTLILNINNNSRSVFSTYDLKFTHILSQSVNNFTIDLSDSTEYSVNSRYCTITFISNFDYEGEYSLEIRGNNTELVWSGIIIVGEVIPTDTFNELVSDNEENNNFIYIE